MPDLQICDREQADGLTERIQASARLRILARAAQSIKPLGLSVAQLPDNAKAGLTDFDLYHLSAVLCTAGDVAGWNKNDDVFDSQETWNARATPLHKPVNWEHKEGDVIGHIISADVVADNQVCEEMPAGPFDVVVASVLYRKQENADRQQRMNDLIQGIGDGNWFVSMECLLKQFDYAIQMRDGSLKTIARNAATAFLTKHLRLYGGTGEYNGHKVGRLLRNFTFSGMGMVQTPANDRSIILPAATATEAAGYRELDFMSFCKTAKQSDPATIKVAANWIRGQMEK
jgi:hypothetical protein